MIPASTRLFSILELDRDHLAEGSGCRNYRCSASSSFWLPMLGLERPRNRDARKDPILCDTHSIGKSLRESDGRNHGTIPSAQGCRQQTLLEAKRCPVTVTDLSSLFVLGGVQYLNYLIQSAVGASVASRPLPAAS